MSLWDKTDRIERRYLLLIIRKFKALRRKTLFFDELNILQGVDQTYAEVDALCKEAFRKMIDDYYEYWLWEQLEEYDPVTKYRWSTEFARKRQRLFETLMADFLSGKPKSVINHDIDIAMRYIERQFNQTGDDITAAYILKTYEDEGVERVMWVTARDEKVCEECAPRDGKIYPLDDHPQWPAHYYCRCELIPVK